MKIKYTKEEYELIGGDKACLNAMCDISRASLRELSGTKKFDMWFNNEILKVREAQKEGKNERI